MTDYVSLVKELRKAHDFSTNLLSNPYRFCAYYKAAADAIENLNKQCDTLVADNVKLVEQLPQWIPVSERFPDDGMPVLICSDDNGIDIGTYDTEFKHWYDFNSVRTFVHHWMPLPQPPQEKVTEK